MQAALNCIAMSNDLSQRSNSIVFLFYAKANKFRHRAHFRIDVLVTGLAGATADVHCYDVLSNKWSRYSLLITCVLHGFYVLVLF
jgi:hypothetical protein